MFGRERFQNVCMVSSIAVFFVLFFGVTIQNRVHEDITTIDSSSGEFEILSLLKLNRTFAILVSGLSFSLAIYTGYVILYFTIRYLQLTQNHQIDLTAAAMLKISNDCELTTFTSIDDFKTDIGTHNESISNNGTIIEGKITMGAGREKLDELKKELNKGDPKNGHGHDKRKRRDLQNGGHDQMDAIYEMYETQSVNSHENAIFETDTGNLDLVLEASLGLYYYIWLFSSIIMFTTGCVSISAYRSVCKQLNPISKQYQEQKRKKYKTRCEVDEERRGRTMTQ